MSVNNTRILRLPYTSINSAQTLLQIKTGNAPIDIIAIKVHQASFTATQLLEISASIWSGGFTAATVTAATASVNFDSLNLSDPIASSLVVISTSGTGYNATAEPSGGTRHILQQDVWNVLNGSWQYLPVPEERIRVPISSLFTLNFDNAPSSTGTIGAYIIFHEFL